MQVHIPVYAIHHDSDIFEYPDRFMPERFTPEEIAKRPACSFLAFGDGSRNCVAFQFGMHEIRVALAKMLINFEFSVCTRTKIPVEFDMKKSTLTPIPIWLKVKKIA